MADRKDSDLPEKPKEVAGKISHDARGNAVWQWGSGSDRQPMDSTSRMLKQLDVPGLTLLDDDKDTPPTPAEALEALKTQRATGFNPYEGPQGNAAPKPAAASRAPAAPTPAPAKPGAAKPAAARPAAKPAPKPDVPAAKQQKPGLLSRLFGKDPDE